MTRSLFGAAPGDLFTVVGSDPTPTNPTHRDLSPMAGVITIWSYDRSTRIMDLLAADPVTLAPGDAITQVTADATTGRGAFYGVDGYQGSYWGKDADGKWWHLPPADIDLVIAAGDISDVTEVGEALITAPDTAAARTAIGALSNLWIMPVWDGTGPHPTRPVGLPDWMTVWWWQPSAPLSGPTYARKGIDRWTGTAS